MGDGGAIFGRGTFSHAGAATSNEGGGGHSRLSRAARQHGSTAVPSAAAPPDCRGESWQDGGYCDGL
jgi:hypothetical protein